MINVNYIFVVVVYRNGEDLITFNQSLKPWLNNYKIVVVDSYCSELCSIRIKDICKKINADYFVVENKGYGSGNNAGINYVKNHYNFNYCIISNADIELLKFDDKFLPKSNAVIGPRIVTINGKDQNPYWYRRNFLGEWFIYKFIKKRMDKLCWIVYAYNRLVREFFLKTNKKKITEVYALHGAFIIFPKDVVYKINEIFDQKMFLYNEEAYLALILENKNIKKYLDLDIVVRHKEGGSTVGMDFNSRRFYSKSFIRYFETNCRQRL